MEKRERPLRDCWGLFSSGWGMIQKDWIMTRCLHLSCPWTLMQLLFSFSHLCLRCLIFQWDHSKASYPVMFTARSGMPDSEFDYLFCTLFHRLLLLLTMSDSMWKSHTRRRPIRRPCNGWNLSWQLIGNCHSCLANARQFMHVACFHVKTLHRWRLHLRLW